MRYHFEPLSIALVVTALVMSLGCEGEDLTTANTTLFKRRQPVASSPMNGEIGKQSPLPDHASPEPSPSPVATASVEPEATASPEETLEASVDPSPDVTPDPIPMPTESPSPSPTAPPTPTPLPTPSVARVVVSPNLATLNASSPGNAAAGFVTSVRLSATVTMSDGTTHDRVTWSSSDPQRAMVAADGTVTAPSTATAGEVVITATPQGSSISASATLTVTTNGRVMVIVE